METKAPASDAPKPLFERAQKGDAEVQFKLGVMYDGGQGVTQDYVEAHVYPPGGKPRL